MNRQDKTQQSVPGDGFTLIEVVIAMLIMGILASSAIPRYTTALANYRVDMAARRIVADLQYARSEAQKNSQNRALQFDVSQNRYTLESVNDLDRVTESYVISLAADPYASQVVSAAFAIDGATTTSNVVFDMFGRPDRPGTIVVRSAAETKTVNLAADGTITTL